MTYSTMPENDDITILGGTSEAINKDWNDFWEEDGISLTGNPYYSPDTIKFTMSENEDGTLNLSKEIVGSRLPGGMGEDHISLSLFNVNIPDLPKTPTNENGFWKYNEDVVLKEIRDYLGGTYRSHYASAESKTQTLDLIESVGDAEPFCRSNAIKYLSRFGKKNGKSKQDILKAIHYCILLYHFAGLCNENSQPYETF
jgi:hypothetical protein